MKIEDIKGETFIFGLLDLLFLIAPGIAVIFLQYPSLITDLDWIKLLFLSVAVVTPTAFLAVTLMTIRHSLESSKGMDMFLSFSLGLMCNGLAIYIILLINLFYPKPLYQYFVFIGVIFLFCIIISVIKIRKLNKAK